MGHKVMAQHFGLYTKLEIFPRGPSHAMITCVFKEKNKREKGLISLAGPLTNIGIALVALSLWVLNLETINSISFFIFSINSFFALINMLPFGISDGKKVLEWNCIAFASTIEIAFLMFSFAIINQLL
ncbi:MAG: hypothetical protein U9N35_07245 [Euryarchaeota archaeon]|nr:hypothetical protein [Euryarchaeota archaeon]